MVAGSLFKAFSQAKDIEYEKMRYRGTLRYMLPWMHAEIDDLDKVFGDPQVAHLGVVQDIDTEDARGVLHVIGQPVSLARTPSRLVAPPPERGQHTQEVLREFGFSDAEIAGLREHKVI